MSIFNRIFKARDKPKSSLTGSSYNFIFGRTTNGKAVQPCRRLLSMPVCGSFQRPSPACRYTFLYTDRGKEKALQHTLYNLLYAEPNQEMTSFLFRETLIVSLSWKKACVSRRSASLPSRHSFWKPGSFRSTRSLESSERSPHMLADLEKSSLSNIKQQSLDFVKYTPDPWVIRWEMAIQKALFTPAEKKQFFVKFNLDGLLRGDYLPAALKYPRLGMT